MQRIHGEVLLAQMVTHLRRLLKQGHGHGGVAAGVQDAPAFQQDPHPDGGFLLPVHRVQQRIRLLVASLQADGPPQLGGEFGLFVGVVRRIGKGVPEALLGQLGILNFP